MKQFVNLIVPSKERNPVDFFEQLKLKCSRKGILHKFEAAMSRAEAGREAIFNWDALAIRGLKVLQEGK